MAHASTIASQPPQWDGDTLVIEWPPCQLDDAEMCDLIHASGTVNATPFFGEPAGTVICGPLEIQVTDTGKHCVKLTFRRHCSGVAQIYDPQTGTVGHYPTHATADFGRLIR